MISNNDCETVLRLQQLIAEEEMLWLKHFDSLTDKEAEVLILAKKMGQITNKDIRENIGLDTLQASSILRKFCKNNYLLKHGKSSNSYYLLNSCYTDNCDSLAGNDQALTGASTGINKPSYPINATSTGHNEQNNGGKQENNGGNQENNGGNSLQTLKEIAKIITNSERTKVEIMYQVLLQMCEIEALSAATLSEVLDRKPRTLREHLSKLVEKGYLAYIYPDYVKHKSQAYRTTEKGRAYLETLEDNPQQNLLI